MQLEDHAPRTIPQLITAIESLFVPRGDFGGRATMMVGDQVLRAVTYATGYRLDHDSIPLNAWHPGAEAAIAGHWKAMVRIHSGEKPYSNLPFADAEPEIEGERPVPPRSIFWRKKPELVFADTGIVYVRMRAAFV